MSENLKVTDLYPTIKTELSYLIPRELAVNLDFWYNIKDNAYLYVPMSFINYMSHKYAYHIDIMNSLEVRQHILDIAKDLSGDSFKLESYRQLPTAEAFDAKISPFLERGNIIPITKTYTKPNKDRKRLLQDTPLAEFNEQ